MGKSLLARALCYPHRGSLLLQRPRNHSPKSETLALTWSQRLHALDCRIFAENADAEVVEGDVNSLKINKEDTLVCSN